MKSLCLRFGVSRSGYYAWRRHSQSQRSMSDAKLLERIVAIHKASESSYGSPRIHAALQTAGIRVGRKRVARLMRQAGVRARADRIYRRRPGHKRFYDGIPNQVLNLATTGIDQVWVGDITYLRCGGSWRYLAAIMDRHSRRIVGWKLGAQRDLRLTLSALDDALTRRHPGPGLIFHSDRGIEYGGHRYRARLAAAGIIQSMKRPRELGDNAYIESFFASMKADLIHATVFTDDLLLRRAVTSYIRRYNRTRLHSSLGYRSPIDFERRTA